MLHARTAAVRVPDIAITSFGYFMATAVAIKSFAIIQVTFKALALSRNNMHHLQLQIIMK